MKRKIVLGLLCILGFVWCLRSCKPIETHSPIPEIRFKEIFVEDRYDTTLKQVRRKAILNFSFIDGDGDLGDKGDKTSKIFYTWYQKTPDAKYELFQFGNGETTMTSDIPYSEVMNKDEANNKVLKGTIEIELFTPIEQYLDTMRVEFYITDRARHESNTEHTPDFSLKNISKPVK